MRGQIWGDGLRQRRAGIYKDSKKLPHPGNAELLRKQEFFVRVELCTAQPHQVELYTVYHRCVRMEDKEFCERKRWDVGQAEKCRAGEGWEAA